MSSKFNSIIVACILAVGLIVAGYLIGKSIERFRLEDRSISVKGLAEKEVKSDLAIWQIQTKVTTNDMIEGSRHIEENKSKIIDFLKSNGFADDEIVVQNSKVTDKLARDYGSENIGVFRYIIENTIQVRTENVDIVNKVSKQTDKLLKMGVLITDSYNTVQYLYTGLNSIKPQMLAEATQNAKKAAEEFTKESDVKLDKLRKAGQGLFSIVDRDYSIMQATSGGYYDAVNDLYKNVRVVVSVEYSIK